MGSPAPNPGKELRGIQYLRGLAASLVVFEHVSSMSELPKYFGAAPLGGFMAVGAVGVDLFFVISGFIIVYVSLHSAQLSPRMSARTFITRRFVRIVPFLWVCVLAYALLRIAGRGAFEAGPYIRALTLFPIGSVLPNTVWTLRHEFLFYLVFTSCLSLRQLRFAPLALWLGVSILYGIANTAPAQATDSASAQLLGFVLNKVNILFGFGVLAGMLFCAYGDRLRLAFSPLTYLALTVALLLVCNVFDYQRGNFPQVFIVGLICLAILACALASHDLGGGGLPGPLDQLAGQLGDASYSIYLTHLIFVSAVIGVLSKHYPHANLLLVLLGVSIATIAAGVACHHLVERPVLRWSRRILEPARAPATVAERS